MSWQIVIDGVPDAREFKDYREFNAALRADVARGAYSPSADIQVRRRPPEPAAPEAPAAEPQPGPETIYRPVFTYERRLNHNAVMSTAVALGALIGLVMGKLL